MNPRPNHVQRAKRTFGRLDCGRGGKLLAKFATRTSGFRCFPVAKAWRLTYNSNSRGNANSAGRPNRLLP